MALSVSGSNKPISAAAESARATKPKKVAKTAPAKKARQRRP
jgi:hypothetical protein